MVMYDWLVEIQQEKGELRFGTTAGGILYVMIPGVSMMQKLFASNLDTEVLQQLSIGLTLGRALDKYCWMTYIAPEGKHLFWSAVTMESTITTVVITRMRV